jgi:hypothetical protein
LFGLHSIQSGIAPETVISFKLPNSCLASWSVYDASSLKRKRDDTEDESDTAPQAHSHILLSHKDRTAIFSIANASITEVTANTIVCFSAS